MFILPGLLGLVIFIYARPFEFVPALRNIPFLYIFFGAAVLGFVIDIRLALTKFKKTPQINWVIAFIVWAIATVFLTGSGFEIGTILGVVIDLALFVLIAHGVQTLKGIEAIAAVVLGCSLWISAICVHQGLSPTECVTVAADEASHSAGVPDGRSCETIEQCYVDAPQPDAIYRCDHAGLLGTTSISGRVRYVGVLLDPNETALVVAIGLPLALGFFFRRKSRSRLMLVALVAILATVTVIFSKSRGGILVLGAVLGTYFVKRFGFKGAVSAAICTLPVLLLGGRGGAEASQSSEQRLLAWFEGLQMFRYHPATGVGLGQFTNHHHLTAHNSFILAPAELGVVGMVTWSTVIYLSAKIPWHAVRSLKGKQAEPARIWGMSLLSSFAGLVVGAFFLSFTYHFVLWIYVGLAGAYFSAVKRHDEDWTVPFGLKDLALIVGVNFAALAFLYFYTAAKLGG